MEMKISIEDLARKVRDVLVKEYGEDVVAKFLPKKEPDDERVRKELLSFCQNRADNFPNDPKYSNIGNWIAWLEKQGKNDILEDAVVDSNDDGLIADALRNKKIEPKFKVGNWITNGDYTWKIIEVKPLDYILQSQDGNIVDDTISHVDGQFHSFTIEDAKDGDVLACPNDAGDRDVVFIFKNINSDEGWVFCFCASDANGCFCTNNDYVGNSNSTNIYPATKEQRNQLERAMTNAGYKWNKEELKLEKI